jgi:hypothetical protein
MHSDVRSVYVIHVALCRAVMISHYVIRPLGCVCVGRMSEVTCAMSVMMATSVWMMVAGHVAAILLLPLVLCVIRTAQMASVPACLTWTHPHALFHSLGTTLGISTTSSLRLKRQNSLRELLQCILILEVMYGIVVEG